MPRANPFDQFDAPSGPASGLGAGDPATGYLVSTYGADVAGAAKRLGHDVDPSASGQTAERAQRINAALAKFKQTGHPADALDLAKEAAGIYADAYHVAADAVNLPLTAAVGGPLHTAIVRPLAEGEHAILSAMPTPERAKRLSDKEKRSLIVAQRGLGAHLPGGLDVSPDQLAKFGNVPSVEDLEKDIWNDLYLGGPKAGEAPAAPSAHEPIIPKLEPMTDRTRAGAARTSAARRLIGQGKLDSRKARQAAQEHRDVDAGDPRLLDVMETPAQRVVRMAGSRAGDADTILEEHRRRARADVGARATQRTESLSPKQGSAEQRVEALKAERDQLAQSKYREPYGHPIETEPSLFEALDSPEAARAIRTARATARERMIADPQAAQQYHELGALDGYFVDKAKYEADVAKHQRLVDAIPANLGPAARQQVMAAIDKEAPVPPEPRPPSISGGALDRVRIHMRDRASQLADSGNMARASGIRSRMDALDEHLDKAPHLQEARASYRDYSERIRQAEFDKDVSTMRPEQFKAMLKDLSPEQRSELQHAVVERLSKRFGASSRGAQGLEDVLTTGYNAKANLTELLGKEVAERYLRAVDLIGQSVDKANFVGSRTGSQTAMIDQDVKDTATRAGLDIISGRFHQAVVQTMRFLARHHLGMGEDEARQIAEWAVQQKDVEATLREIADAAEKGGGPKGLPPELKALFPASVAAGKGAAGAGDSTGGTADADKGPKEANPFDQFDAPQTGRPATGQPDTPPAKDHLTIIKTPPPGEHASAPQQVSSDSDDLPIEPAAYANALTGHESAGDPIARNPRSSATGVAQFVRGTWLKVMQQPEFAKDIDGKSPEQILAMRTDPEISKRAIIAYARMNAKDLRAYGDPVNATTLGLAHGFGSKGAHIILAAAPDTPMSSLFGEDVLSENPELRRMTSGQVFNGFERRFGGAAPETDVGAVEQARSGSSQRVPQDAAAGALADMAAFENQ